MSSSTRLLVLGVVRLFQPVHGYEVRRELMTWRASEWASVQPGSVYNALKTLTRDGFLEVVGTDQVGGRPERTTYQLTTGGDEELRNLLREEWWTVRTPVDPLMAAISFLNFVARDEAIMALEHRATQIRGLVRHAERGIEDHDGTESPHHVREMMRLMNARMFAEIAWSEQLIARLRAGEYATKGDPPWAAASEARAEAGKRRKRSLARRDTARATATTQAALASAQLALDEPARGATGAARRAPRPAAPRTAKAASAPAAQPATPAARPTRTANAARAAAANPTTPAAGRTASTTPTPRATKATRAIPARRARAASRATPTRRAGARR